MKYKIVYKITYPNGKIYVRSDLTGGKQMRHHSIYNSWIVQYVSNLQQG